jgi:hypothetical protein
MPIDGEKQHDDQSGTESQHETPGEPPEAWHYRWGRTALRR